MENYSERDLVVEVMNKLFVYTDQQEWHKLQHEVFTPEVMFDMSSMGGEKMVTTATNICSMWQKGFEGIDSVNHLAGNFLIDIKNENATAFAYATATHYKKAATQGTTRDFVGTYDIELTKTASGWRINLFKYNLKYATGNVGLV